MAIDRHNIKDKFRPEETLPEGFGWEDMEHGISEKMNTKKTNSFSFDKRYSILLALLFIGGATFYFLNKTTTSFVKNAKVSNVEAEIFSNTSNISSNVEDKKQDRQETRLQEKRRQKDKRQEGQDTRTQDKKRQEETRSQETRGQETRGQEDKKQDRQETRLQETRGQKDKRQEGQDTRTQDKKRQEETRSQETRGQDKKTQDRQETRLQEKRGQKDKRQEGQDTRTQDKKRQEETRSQETRGQEDKTQEGQEDKKQIGKESRIQEGKKQETRIQEYKRQEAIGTAINIATSKENQQEGSKKINNINDVKASDVLVQSVENKAFESKENTSLKATNSMAKDKEINVQTNGEEPEVKSVASVLNTVSIAEKKDESIERKQLESSSFIALVNQKNLQSQNINNINVENKLSFIQPQIDRKSSFEDRNMIYLFGGVNQHYSLYGKDSIGDIKNQYERSRQAMSIGIGIEKKLSKKLSLDAAINYHKIKSILDYDSVETRYNKVKQNVLISQNFNAITGDTIKTYGTALVSGKKIRTVLHHNTETAIHIPIVFRYNWQVQKLSIGLGLGPSIHYTLSNDGRTVEAFDQFKTIDNNFLAKWYVTGIAQLKLGYDVSNKISIGTKISTTLPLSNINKEVGTSLRRSMVIGQIYAGYRF